MGAVSDAPYRPEAGDPVELALALCHEAGNLLAAARLSAYLIGRETESEQIQASAEDIETISTQAGAVLAHMRPLLIDDPAARMHVDPAEVLRGVDRTLAQQSDRAPAVSVDVSDDHPDVWVDTDALHHLLVTLVLSAWDAAPKGTEVQVSAGSEGDGVLFSVEDEGRADELEKADPRVGPTGRALALGVAATLVERWGGEVRVDRSEAWTRVELWLPAAAE
jgi:signal transduction histidine kinase